MTDAEKIVTSNVIYLRKMSNYSQVDLSQKMGIFRSKINSIETYRSKPSIDNLIMLSRIFEISLDILMKEDLRLKAKNIFNIK
jgi:transcriptional regulator with XRE-family HTH domain